MKQWTSEIKDMSLEEEGILLLRSTLKNREAEEVTREDDDDERRGIKKQQEEEEEEVRTEPRTNHFKGSFPFLAFKFHMPFIPYCFLSLFLWFRDPFFSVLSLNK